MQPVILNLAPPENSLEMTLLAAQKSLPVWCQELYLFSPELTLISFLVLAFLADALLPKWRNSYLSLILVVAGCVIASVLNHRLSVFPTVSYFSGMVVHDGFGSFFRYIFFFACGVSAYLSFGSKELEYENRNEFSLLLLCVTIGMCLMALSTNLLMLYIAIETVSIVSFVLAGFHRESLKSNEASFKYFVFGAFASGLMIYGFSLLYGFTGSLQFSEIAKYLIAHSGETPLLVVLSTCLAYLGLAYKISAFPMHFWTPDVYEGAPTPIVTFFSVGPKAAGFAALLRILFEVFTVKSGTGQWQPLAGSYLVEILSGIAVITMFIGNLSALHQKSVKRMLAYSSIAHVGYMLLGLVVLNRDGISAILFYIVIYCGMNIGAFWVVSLVSHFTGRDDLDAYRGLGWNLPLVGICMGIFLFSLTGIPMFAGFIGKFLLFSALIKTPGFVTLALLGVLNSVISFYYYAQILRAMWFDKPSGTLSPNFSVGPNGAATVPVYHAIGLVGLAIPTLVLGLYFTPVIRWIEISLASFN